MHLLKLLGTLYKVKVNRLENLNSSKEERTKFTLAPINNVNLNSITDPGFYVSAAWDNNFGNLPSEIDKPDSRAFYLTVFALGGGTYCQQILYSFKGIIFYRVITGATGVFTPWKKII